MKTARLIVLAFSIMGFLLGCEPIQGTLQILNPLKAIEGQTPTNCNSYNPNCQDPKKPITVPVGTYKAKLDRLGKTTLLLKFKVGRQDKVLELNVPRGKEVPETGVFTLSAQESGQPFDLTAQTETVIDRTPEQREQESCQITYHETVCGVVGNPPQYTCWTETHYRYGWQEVVYYLKTTRQSMQSEITQAGQSAATFEGERSSSEKIYTYKGICY